MFQEGFRDVFRVFQGNIKVQRCCKKVLRAFQVTFKGVSRGCQGCVEDVSWNFQLNVCGVSKKFHAAWHSLQLPEQKEGLLFFPQKVGGSDPRWKIPLCQLHC